MSTETVDTQAPAMPEPNKKTTEFLQYFFSEEERMGLAKDLARTGREKRNLELQKAQVTKQLGGEIAAKDTELERLQNLFESGCEWRNIPCGIYFDTPRKGRCQIIRLDTGEIVNERPMRDDELQMALDLAEKQAEGATDAEPAE